MAFKRTFAILLVIAMVFSFSAMPAYAAWDNGPVVSLSVGDLYGDNGDKVDVTIHVPATVDDGIYALSLGVKYDPNLVEPNTSNGNYQSEDYEIEVQGISFTSENFSGIITRMAMSNTTINPENTDLAGNTSFQVVAAREKGITDKGFNIIYHFTVKPDVMASGGVVEFSIANGTMSGNTPTFKIVGSPNTKTADYPTANYSDTVAIPSSNVAVGGTITATLKGNTSPSVNLTTDKGFKVESTWSPALTDGKFVANTTYTLTVKVSEDGGEFADNATVTADTSLGLTSFTKGTDGYTATRNFVIPDKALEGIQVTTNPTTMTYQHGDTLDKNGMAVTATYDDGSTADVTANTIVQYKNGSALSKGDTAVTLSYTEGDVTKTATLDGLTVNAKQLTVTVNDIADQAYTGSQITPEPVVNSGVDGLSLVKDTDYTVTYDANVNAGTNAGSVTVAPVENGNYTFTAVTKNFTISTKALTADDFTIDTEDKTYTGSQITPTVTPKNGLVLNQDYTVTYGENKNAGDNAGTITVAGIGNYSGSIQETFNIKQVDVTITGVTITDTKEYNGTTTAAITNYGTVSGVLSGDTVTVDQTNAAANYDNKNVGTEKPVTFTGFALSGDDAANYNLTAQPTGTTASITAKAVTITGVTITDTKEYDGNTTAAITNYGTVSGVVNGETVTVNQTNAAANYDDANVGTDKPVTFTGFALSGTDAANYNLTGQPEAKTAAITAKTVTITGVTITDTKEYDGNTTAAITNYGTVSGVVNGETVTVNQTNAAANYDDANVGTDKPVTFTNFALTGTDAANYSLTGQPEAQTANITAKGLTITGLSAENKKFDGNTEATVKGNPVIVGKVDGDIIGLDTGTAAFEDANVGDNKTVTFSGYSLFGDKASNYSLTQPADVKANITKADPLTLTAADQTLLSKKVVGTDSRNYSFDLASIIQGIETDAPKASAKYTKVENSPGISDLTLNETTGALTFTIASAKDAGQSETVKVKVATTNYADSEVTITFKYMDKNPIEGVTFANDTVTYDGQTHKLTATLPAGFATTATNPSYTYKDSSGAALEAGAFPKDADTYTVTAVYDLPINDPTATGYPGYYWTGSVTLTINRANATVKANDAGKTYGENDPATFTATVTGTIGSDTLTYEVTRAEGDAVNTYTITPAGDAKQGNYNVAYETGTFTISAKSASDASITAAQAQGETLTYDGEANPPTITVKDGEKGLTAGTDYTVKYQGVSPTEYALSDTAPTDSGSYKAVITFQGNYTGTKEVPFTIAKADSSVTTAPTAKENLTYSGAAQDLVTAGTATGGTMKYSTDNGSTWSETVPTGTNAGDYTVYYKVAGDENHNDTEKAPADGIAVSIAPKTITMSGLTAKDRAYNGTTTVSLENGVLQGFYEVDNNKIGFTRGSGTMKDANAGDNKSVTTNVVLSGSAKDNYVLTQPTDVTVNITPKDVTITGVTITSTKEYDGNTTAAITNYGSVSGVLDNDTVTVNQAGATANYDTKDVGANKPVTFTGFALSGTDAANYNLTAQPAGTTAAITAKAVTITGLTPQDKDYDGTTQVTIEGTAAVSGKVGDDDVSVTAGTAAFADKNVGANKTVTFTGYALSGADAGNYTLTAQPAGTASINKATRTVTPAPTTLSLTPNANTGIVALSFDDVGNNAKIECALDSKVVKVTPNGKSFTFEAVDNGSATATFTVTGANYNDATATVTINSVADAITDVSVSTTGSNTGNDAVSAALSDDGKSIVVTGTKAADSELSIQPTMANESWTSALSEDGKTLTVKNGDQTIATYAVDDQTTALPSNPIEITVGAQGQGPNADPDDLKAAVSALINGAAAAGDTSATVQPNLTAITSAGGNPSYAVEFAPTFTTNSLTDPQTIDTLAGKVKITTPLPAGFIPTSVTQDGKAIDFTFDDPNEPTTVSWDQEKPGRVTMTRDDRSGSITYNKNDGSTITLPYTAADLGKALETDTKSGSTFSGWTIPGFNDKLTNLTEELLAALNDAPNKTLTATPNFSGGGGGGGGGGGAPIVPDPITIDQPENGSLTVSPKTPKAGDPVTVTPTPDEGYKTDKVTVTDSKGKEVPVTEQDGKYTFILPENTPVKVSATFTKGETPPEPAQRFVDVPESAYYYDAVYWAVENGITAGTDATHFSPSNPCTRGQAVTFLWRAAGEPAPASTANPFTDVSSRDYFYNAVLWAVEKGVTVGTSDTTFSPNKTVNRGQMVTFLYRAAGEPAVTQANPFTDVSASDYFYNAVLWAVDKGITTGTSATTFSPKDSCLRSQIVTFLYRAAQ